MLRQSASYMQFHMDSPQYKKLQDAVEFVRQSFADKGINLDYTPESVKHLDKLFDDEVRNGNPRNPDSGFAKFQGVIMAGTTGYLTEVVLRHTHNGQLDIDPNDEHWYLNFKVVAENTWTIQPGQRVLKRMQQGNEAEFYAYILSAIKYFSQPKADATEEHPNEGYTYTQEVYVRDETKEEKKKPWWKLW